MAYGIEDFLGMKNIKHWAGTAMCKWAWCLVLVAGLATTATGLAILSKNEANATGFVLVSIFPFGLFVWFLLTCYCYHRQQQADYHTV